MNKKWHLIFLGLLLITIAIAWFLTQLDTAVKNIQNVVLISIDTCRADYLSCYGYPHKTTPNIDAIADTGIVFENVISPVPLTLPAHASMLTGTIPPYHGVHDNFNYWLGSSNITLAETLKDNGFTTAAIISAFVMDSQFGLNQGFDTYQDRFQHQVNQPEASERPGWQTSLLAQNWLDQRKNEKFFLFLHYYDPHTKYEPPEPFASKFADNLYAGEIAYTDYCIAQVIQKLKDLGLFDSTLLIITGDHGEMLGEHREQEHGYFIYQSAIKVPLIFKLPQQRKSKNIKDTVSLIDIVPTICSLLNIQPPPQLQGKDLSLYFSGNHKPAEQRYLYCESLTSTKYGCSPLLGVISEGWKYIQTTKPELYDTNKDTAESVNLIEKHPHQARILQDQIKQVLEKSIPSADSDSKAPMDEKTRKRLESLGYVAAAVREDFQFDQSKDDPKDLIDLHLDNLTINNLIAQKKFDQAKISCEKIVSQRPDFYEIYRSLGRIAFEQGDREKSVAYVLKSLEINPNQADLHTNVAVTLTELNKFDQAIEHFNKSLRLNPNQIGIHFGIANIFEQQGKLEQAAEIYNKVLQSKPNMAPAHNNLGKILLLQGKYEQAAAHCIRALQINPQLPEAYYNLGNTRFQQANYQQAIANYQKALSLRPNWPEVQMNLNLAKKKMSQKNMP
ncbi:MAG: sulfatase-like hydrolase/transferase [Sedimentisphaerales bacterium]|nr:sulfatase-like hydrolase/transferase [Sedimentisphaerales bacterium]